MRRARRLECETCGATRFLVLSLPVEEALVLGNANILLALGVALPWRFRHRTLLCPLLVAKVDREASRSALRQPLRPARATRPRQLSEEHVTDAELPWLRRSERTVRVLANSDRGYSASVNPSPRRNITTSPAGVTSSPW